jgi:hypothetical protein
VEHELDRRRAVVPADEDGGVVGVEDPGVFVERSSPTP